MVDTLAPPKQKKRTELKKKHEKPRDVQILLQVCNCYARNPITLHTDRATAIAKILRISVKDLEVFAIQAMITGTPQIVGCFNPEIAETKVIELRRQTPFISGPCHHFYSQKT